jgi:hypothetical protein
LPLQWPSAPLKQQFKFGTNLRLDRRESQI